MYRLCTAFFLVFLSVSASASSSASPDITKILNESRAENLSQEKQWQKLLHREPNFWGFLEGQIDSPNFYLSSQGKKNAQAELEATLEGLMQTVKEGEDPNNHAQCRFPARHKWLQEKIGSGIFPKINCDRYAAFFKGMGGESVSLIFSSYYLNNPSSAFGHTFLRINKPLNAKAERHEFLDYGINYAAETDTNNAFLYGFKGLFGLFPGKFKSIPYYYKVREYNNAESRDLWEYNLSLNQDAVDMLVAHVWELGPTEIDYWYLTENCSYHMLSLLEAADPEAEILTHLKKFVIPSDTVSVLWNKTNLVKTFKYRPSIREIFFKRKELLTSPELEELRKLSLQIQKQDEMVYDSQFLNLDESSQSRILDAFSDYIDFTYPSEVQQNSREFQIKLKVMEQRSKIQLTSAPVVVIPAENQYPHLAHGSRRWGLGYEGSDERTLVSYRFSLHDRLDPQWGYPTQNNLSFFDFDFSYGKSHDSESKVELENFSVFELFSANAWAHWTPANSWNFKLGAEREYNQNFLPTHVGVLRMGYGYTVGLGNFDFSAHLQGEVKYGPWMVKDTVWVGAGPLVEMHFRMTSDIQWKFGTEYRRDSAFEEKDYLKYQVQTQWSMSKNWGLRASYSDQRFLEKWSVQLFNYY